MRPFPAMGDVQWRTLGQLPVASWNTDAPVSPSIAISLSPLMNQTSTSDLPSVVVAIGAAPPAAAKHQAICGLGGAPAGISMETITLSVTPVVPGHGIPLSAQNVTCTP